jgi:hypothetical protein
LDSTLREKAEYIGLGLAMGLLDASDVVAWADSCIVATDDPPFVLFDISLAIERSNYEIIKLLHEIPGSGDYACAAHRALGLLLDYFQSGDVSLDYAVKALHAYYNWAQVSEQEGLLAHNFGDVLYCTKQGYMGSLDDVKLDLLAFLNQNALEPDV